MKPILIFILCLSNCLMTLSQENNEEDYTEALKLIDAWLAAQRDYENLPGISVAIIKDQDLIWSSAYGMANVENKGNTEVNTIYSICSISKLFTSVAIMKLFDAGKLRLDDKVGDLLPWFNIEQQFEDSGPITVRSLLTHSSGLPRESGYPYWTGPDFPFPSQLEVKSKLGDQKTLYPASKYIQYSNLGLTLLGEIVEEVSGQPYDEFVQENILNPLKLESTSTKLPESLLGSKLALGYSSITRGGERDKVKLFQGEGIRAAAGYSSTVEDLGKFASWQFRLRSTGGEEILKSSTLKEMQRVHWMNPDWETSWGLGFSVYKSDGKTMVGHGGSCPGYRSSLSIDLENKIAYVVMINASGTNPGKYVRGIRGILKKVKPIATQDSDANVNLNDYSGYYNSQPWSGEVFISPSQGKLVLLNLPSNDPEEGITFIKHIQGDTFRRIRDDDNLGEEITFERDNTGKVIRMWQHSNYSDKLIN